MAALTCPECAAVIKPASPPAGRKVRCPKCGTVFRPAEDEDDGLIAAVPLTPLPARRPAPPRRRRDDEDDRPAARPVKRGGGVLLLVLGLGMGAFALVLLAGCGVGAYFLLLPSDDTTENQPVANAPADPGPAAQPLKVADGPKAAPPQANPPGPPVAPLQPADPGPAGEPAATTIPLEALKGLKAATVFVKVQAGNAEASGSGFLIRADGDSGFVVTNHHVITPPDEGFGPGRFARPMFRNPGPPNLTLVFWSGTPQEQSVRGEAVADDKDVDLAVLHFRGLANPPHPLDPRQQPRLAETMPVFLLGFPFGEALAMNKGNPAITVGKGSVSSIRTNERGEVARVQIDGDLNPGNSGGPVVDAQGRLVGVAVAKVRGTNIGLAIPAAQLTKVLAGKVPVFSVTTAKVENGTASVQVVAQVVDPMRQLRGMTVYYVRGVQAGQAGALQGAQKADLLVNNERATAQLALPTPDQGDNTYSFQVAYVNGDGQTVLTAPLVTRVGVVVAAQPPPNQQPGVRPNPPPPQRRVLTDAELDQAIKDLQSTDGFARKRAAQQLVMAEPKERRAEVVKALETQLKDSDTFLRCDVIKALGVWGGKDAVPQLLPMLKDSQVFVQWAVLDALTQFKDERSAEPLAECLTNMQVRSRAAQALRAIGAPAEKPVLKYIDHQDWTVRQEVCRILKDIGTKESVPALQKASGDQPFVGPLAKQALEAIQARH